MRMYTTNYSGSCIYGIYISHGAQGVRAKSIREFIDVQTRA